MDPEIKELLEKNLALNEENNRLLRGLRRSNRLALVWRVIYIGIFLGGAALAFTTLKPYYEGVKQTYGSIVDTQKEINSGFQGFKGFFQKDEAATTTAQ